MNLLTATPATDAPPRIATVVDDDRVDSAQRKLAADAEPRRAALSEASGVNPTAEPKPLRAVGSAPAEASPEKFGTSGDDDPDCGLTQTLAAALQADEAVVQALARVPTMARSVAGAVMLWSGQWEPAATLGGPDVLDPVRSAASRAIEAATPACREQILRGPRLIIVRTRSEALVLVFGSGVWRWSELLER